MRRISKSGIKVPLLAKKLGESGRVLPRPKDVVAIMLVSWRVRTDASATRACGSSPPTILETLHVVLKLH